MASFLYGAFDMFAWICTIFVHFIIGCVMWYHMALNFHSREFLCLSYYVIIMKIIFMKCFVCHVMNISNRHCMSLPSNQWVCSSTSRLVLCSAMIVIAFTFAACHNGNGKDNGSWLQQALSVYVHSICLAINTLCPDQ